MPVTDRAALSVEHVSKSFQGSSGNVSALSDVTFTVGWGEFFSIVGPSGCGKSTLLSIIAGLEQEDAGEIMVGADPVSARTKELPGGGHRVRPYSDSNSRLGQIAYMPQKDLLLPWRTVLQNAALGLELTGVPGKVARQRASELLQRFGLGDFAESYPAELSGGMRQRAAFLRTILTDRELVLLDEPFGALDALTRRSMQEWLLGVWSELQRTVMLITHDVDEAIFLSDRVAVMSPRPGRITGVHEIELPRPRSIDLLTDPAFIRKKRQLMDELYAGLEESVSYASQ
jgi:ABC-type nitrate/sulfonate/bicarbonate transport system ATPase subunit